MKKPSTANAGPGVEQSGSVLILPCSTVLTRKLKILADFLAREALENPLAGVLLLELGRTLAGAVAA